MTAKRKAEKDPYDFRNPYAILPMTFLRSHRWRMSMEKSCARNRFFRPCSVLSKIALAFFDKLPLGHKFPQRGCVAAEELAACFVHWLRQRRPDACIKRPKQGRRAAE